MSDESQTTPTREELERMQSQVRAQFIEACKRVLHVFKTEDYRVNVRGWVDFEAVIKVHTHDEALMAAKRSFDDEQSEKLTRYISENFPGYAGRGTGDVAIELLKAAYEADGWVLGRPFAVRWRGKELAELDDAELSEAIEWVEDSLLSGDKLPDSYKDGYMALTSEQRKRSKGGIK